MGRLVGHQQRSWRDGGLLEDRCGWQGDWGRRTMIGGLKRRAGGGGGLSWGRIRNAGAWRGEDAGERGAGHGGAAGGCRRRAGAGVGVYIAEGWAGAGRG